MSLTQPIKYHGGKHYLALWIISHFPKHVHYVEPYFGGGSVLLAKNPYGVSEVVNDINGLLMNFWRTLQSKENFQAFRNHLHMIPFASPQFHDSLSKIAQFLVKDKIDIQAAVDFFVSARQSRQGLMKDFATLSRNRTRRGMNEQVSSWLTAIDGLEDVHKRLQQVVILHADAIDVIIQQDGPNTLFYLDPPYMHSERVTTKDYKYEMTEKDHKRLLITLSDIKGRFVLSGYDSSLYRDAMRHHNWFQDHIEIDNKASSKLDKELKTEYIWTNFDWRTK